MAADQVEIQLPITKVLEATTLTATAYYRNRATKAAVTPTTVHYRIDCLTTDKELVAWTVVAVPGENNDITLTSAMNAIQEGINNIERKQITVKTDDGLSTQAIGQALWTVENLRGVP